MDALALLQRDVKGLSESVPTYSGLIALTGVAQAHAVVDHLQLCGTSQIYRGGSHSSQRRLSTMEVEVSLTGFVMGPAFYLCQQLNRSVSPAKLSISQI